MTYVYLSLFVSVVVFLGIDVFSVLKCCSNSHSLEVWDWNCSFLSDRKLYKIQASL